MTFLDITTILSDRIMTTDYDICCKSRQTSKYVHIKLKFEDTKGIIRSSKSNGQKKNDKQ
jgi:hypothetical protein